MYTNVDTFINKRLEIEAKISETKPDIFGLTEINPKNATWKLSDQDMVFQGYTSYTNFTGRGSVLYVKDTISSFEHKISTNCDACVWCEVGLEGGDELVVGVVYRSPSSSDVQNEQLPNMLREVANGKSSHVMIMGDFNYPEIDWGLQMSSAPSKHSSHVFLTGCMDSFLFQHVQQPTHYRAQQKANVLDLLFTNEEGMVDGLEYREPVGSSDHLLLEWTLNCYVPQVSTRVTKYSYDKGDYNMMRTRLRKTDWENLLAGKNVDEMWMSISQLILEAVNEFVPHRIKAATAPVQRRKPVWMNERLLGRIKQKRAAFKRYLETKDGQDYLDYTRTRNTTKNDIRKAVKDYEKEIAKKAKRDPKAFYRFVNGNLKTRTRTTDMRREDGTVIKDDIEKADAFNGFFSSVFTQEDKNIPDKLNVTVLQNLDDISFSVNDIAQLLLHVNSTKSPGPDNIHPQVLKECAGELSLPLHTLFRKSLNCGKLPQAWKDGNITPIFKKGTRSDVANYRPISLTSVCCKIFEKLIRNALLNHMIVNKFLSDYQHGFIQGRSCTTQLLRVIDKWTEILDNGGAVDTIYLDFAKAFDTVPHKRLLLKLESYGVSGRVLDWIRNFLLARRQRVTIAGASSRWAGVDSGVPQGSVLGPVLFICYINDLPEMIASLIYMYADDTKVSRAVNCDMDRVALQGDLDQLVEWSRIWQLQFNVGKCKVMHLGRANPKAEYRMRQTRDGKSESIALQESAEEKDLGVWITDNLKSSVHVAHAVSKANQILGLIRRTFSYLDMPLVKQLYTAMVRPHLEYANVVWHPYLKKDIDLLERVQHRATRLVPGLSKLSYEERLRRMQLPSLTYRRLRGDAIEVFKYLHGIYKIDNTILPLEHRQGMKTRGHSLKIEKRQCKTALRANVFGLRVVNMWNSLPENIVHSKSVNIFKGRFDRFCDHLTYSSDPAMGISGVKSSQET